MTAADQLAEATTLDLPEVRCAECGRAMVLKTGAFSKFWGCPAFPKCKGRHGAHQQTGLPLGFPGDDATIQARRRAHAAFDPIWKSGDMRRPEAYLWLTRELGLKKQVHIGEADEATCQRIIAACLNRKFGKIRRR